MKIKTIGARISTLCGLLIAFILLLGSITLLKVHTIDTSFRAITTDSWPGTISISKLSITAQEMRSSILAHLCTDQPELKQQLEGKISAGDASFTKELSAYERTITTARDRELFSRVVPAYHRFQEAWAQVKPLSQKGDKGAVDQWLQGGRSDILALQVALNDEFQFNVENGQRYVETENTSVRGAQQWIWSLLLLSTLAGTIVAFLMIRATTTVLRKSIVELTQGARQVASASEQVSASSQSLAQGASQQAASLEETSASSEEVASMTRKNAENTSQSAAIMSLVDEHVAGANRSVGEMVRSMNEIISASDQISHIITVIDGIAFQTNILALNAAVEAARAGEAGMGFAVVADEVRNLAQRADQAAKNTAQLIQSSTLKAHEGRTKLEDVQNKIQSITTDTAQVKILVDEVSTASQEQAKGVGEIANAIAQMQQVTQQAAANAEESAAASEELNAQANNMDEIIGLLRELVVS